MKKLYPVQREHADRLITSLDLYRGALDASQTGCGKTLVAADIAAHYKRPTLVVAPKSSIPMWKREMYYRGIPPLAVVNYEMLRTGNTAWGEWSSPMPRQKIWNWDLPEDALIIWDEVQRCQGMNTQNGKMLWSSKRFFNLCLSATAAEDPTEMKALGYILGLHRLRDFWKWAKQNGCVPGTFGGLSFEGEPEHIGALHDAIFPDHGSRLTINDLKEHFSETQIITTPIDFGPEVEAAYAEMDRELAALQATTVNDTAHILTIRLRARQKVELVKVPYILELTYDLLKEGRHICIFVNFDPTAEALRARLSQQFDVGMITGPHAKNRQKYMDDFAADKLQVMICNVQAGGVSVNLHDVTGKHSRVSIISPSDNAKDVLQCIGRIHRVGGLTPSQQHILFAAGTIEEKVEANCRSKIGQIEIFNEGMC